MFDLLFSDLDTVKLIKIVFKCFHFTWTLSFLMILKQSYLWDFFHDSEHLYFNFITHFVILLSLASVIECVLRGRVGFLQDIFDFQKCIYSVICKLFLIFIADMINNFICIPKFYLIFWSHFYLNRFTNLDGFHRISEKMNQFIFWVMSLGYMLHQSIYCYQKLCLLDFDIINKFMKNILNPSLLHYIIWN